MSESCYVHENEIMMVPEAYPVSECNTHSGNEIQGFSDKQPSNKETSLFMSQLQDKIQVESIAKTCILYSKLVSSIYFQFCTTLEQDY